MPDTSRIRQACLGWLQHIDDSNLVAATVSVKQKLLGELLSLLPAAMDCWVSFAMKLMVALSDLVSADELNPLLSVTDRSSMARALMTITVTTPHA